MSATGRRRSARRDTGTLPDPCARRGVPAIPQRGTVEGRRTLIFAVLRSAQLL